MNVNDLLRMVIFSNDVSKKLRSENLLDENNKLSLDSYNMDQLCEIMQYFDSDGDCIINYNTFTNDEINILVDEYPDFIGYQIYSYYPEIFDELSDINKINLFWRDAENCGIGPMMLMDMATYGFYKQIYIMTKYCKWNSRGEWQEWNRSIKLDPLELHIYKNILKEFNKKDLNSNSAFFLACILVDMKEFGEDVTKYLHHFSNQYTGSINANELETYIKMFN